MKDSVEVQPPGGDRRFIVLRVVTPRNHIAFTPLDDVPLDLTRSPDREVGEEIIWRTHRWPNSPCQPLNRPEDGQTGLVRLFSVHPRIKGFADVGAG